jgi:WSTF, HB1, Itc1p, MBD9 motif 1
VSSRTPPWLGRVADLSETERYAAMTPEQRLQCFVEVCELARAIIEERPDRRAVLRDEDPMPPVAAAAWKRLLREARNARSAR